MAKEKNEGHRFRLREKFQKKGLQKFTDSEILELLLTFATPRMDCKLKAKELLKTFGSLRGVFEASPELLSQVSGIGPVNTILIKFIHETAGLYLEQKLINHSYITSSKEVVAYLKHHIENLNKEIFKVIYLTGANVIISIEDMSHGSVGGAYVHPREVLEKALLLKASGLVLAHNHPSGIIQPSQNDIELTRRLIEAANILEMRVLDHIIVGYGSNDFFSFRDQGLIGNLEYGVENKHRDVTMINKEKKFTIHQK